MSHIYIVINVETKIVDTIANLDPIPKVLTISIIHSYPNIFVYDRLILVGLLKMQSEFSDGH